MKKGTIYDLKTGRVVMTVVAPDEESVHLQIVEREDELGVLLDCQLDPVTQYVDTKTTVVLARPEFPVALTDVTIKVDEVWRVEGIPVGTELDSKYGKFIIDDGEIEWSSIEPGVFRFEFNCFPIQLATVTVTVEAA